MSLQQIILLVVLLVYSALSATSLAAAIKVATPANESMFETQTRRFFKKKRINGV